MRSSKTVVLALLATILAVGLSTPALATPVVDQYTEQVPTPGGPVPMDPGNPGGTGNPGSGGGTSDGAMTYVTPNGEVVTVGSSGAATGENGDGSGSAQGGNRSPGNADTGSGSATGMVTSSSEGDGGMGWLFPAALVLVTGVILGFAIGRRNRGNLAT